MASQNKIDTEMPQTKRFLNVKWAYLQTEIVNSCYLIKEFKLKILVICCLCLSVLQANAQQETMLTQYSSGLQLTNPAYAGTSGRLNVTGIMRNQWVGFEGAPKSKVILANTPLINYHLGIGLTLIRDEIGPTSTTLFYTNIAYNFKANENINVSMGLNGGYSIKKLDNSQLSPVVTTDPVYYTPNQREYLPNFGTGFYIYSSRFYLGFSCPKLLENHYGKTIDGTPIGTEQRHYFIIGGYLFKITELWKTKPSLSLKIVKGAPISLDVTVNTIYKDKFWLGTMYRLKNAFGVILQYQINDKLRVGYSYDLPMTKVLGHAAGSHEILISYDLLFKDKKNASPRYF